MFREKILLYHLFAEVLQEAYIYGVNLNKVTARASEEHRDPLQKIET